MFINNTAILSIVYYWPIFEQHICWQGNKHSTREINEPKLNGRQYENLNKIGLFPLKVLHVIAIMHNQESKHVLAIGAFSFNNS